MVRELLRSQSMYTYKNIQGPQVLTSNAPTTKHYQNQMSLARGVGVKGSLILIRPPDPRE